MPATPEQVQAPGLSTSDQGLYEEITPSGAIKVDLQGRFMSEAYATVGKDGKLVVGHESPADASPVNARVSAPTMAQDGKHGGETGRE